MITFKWASPKKILGLIAPDRLKLIETINESLNNAKERLNSAQESTGLGTKNFYANMMTYIFFLGAFIAFFVVLFVLAQCKSRVKGKLQAKVAQIKAKTLFNGKINAIHVGYIELTIKFQVYVSAMDFTNFRNNYKTLTPQLWPIFYVLVFPWFEVACIFFFKNRLGDPYIQGKIGKMWGNVDPKQGKFALVFRVVQLFRS